MFGVPEFLCEKSQNFYVFSENGATMRSFFEKNPEKIAKNLKNIQKIFELYRVICYNIEMG